MNELDAMNPGMSEAPPALLRKATVLAITGLTDKGLALRLRSGAFPRPVLLDARNPAWLATEVREWIASLVAARDTDSKTPTRIAYEAARKRGGETAQARRRASTTRD